MRKINTKYKLNEIVCRNERAKTLPNRYSIERIAHERASESDGNKESIEFRFSGVVYMCVVQCGSNFGVIHVNNFSSKCSRIFSLAAA